MRIRKVQNQKEFESVIDEYITQGYSTKSRGEESAKLKKADYGGLVAHIIIFLIFGWWTFFIANLLYAGYCYSKGDEVLVKVGEEN